MPVVISQENTPDGGGSGEPPEAFQSNQVNVMRGGAFLLPIFGGGAAGTQAPPAPRNGVSRTEATGVEGASAPHVRLSPRTPTGLPTRGFVLGIPSTYSVGEAAVVEVSAATTGIVLPVITGFTLTVYVRNPTTGSFFATRVLTALLDTLYVLADLNACEIYFSVGVDSIASVNGAAYAGTTSADVGYVPIEIMEIG